MVSLISPSIARSLLAVFDFSRSSYLPLTTLIALGKNLMFGKPKYIVKKKALITSNIITNGAPSNTSKKTILETKSENG